MISLPILRARAWPTYIESVVTAEDCPNFPGASELKGDGPRRSGPFCQAILAAMNTYLLASFNHYPAPGHIILMGQAVGVAAWLVVGLIAWNRARRPNWWTSLLASAVIMPVVWGSAGYWVETHARGDMKFPPFDAMIFGVLGLIVGLVTVLAIVGVARLADRARS